MPFLTVAEREEIQTHLKPDGVEAFGEILKNYKTDLGASAQGHFSQEDQPKIWHKAGAILKQRLIADAGAADRPAVQYTWQKIVEDFYLNNYWGFKLLSGLSPKFEWDDQDLEEKEISEKKTNAIMREAKPYIIRFFVGLVIWKMVILFLAQNGFFDWWGDN